MTEATPYDLLLRGGHVICPVSGFDGIMDIAVHNGLIAAVQPNILPSSAREVGLDADTIGVASGVPTVVDQGGPSCMTLPGFRHYVVENAQTRVYAFLSAYVVGGLEGHYYPYL